MCSTVKRSSTARRRRRGEASRQVGIVEQFADCRGDRLRTVLDQQTGLAVAHGFGHSADVACDHRDARGHRQQHGRPEPFARASCRPAFAARPRSRSRSDAIVTGRPAMRAASAAKVAPFCSAMISDPPPPVVRTGTPSYTTEISLRGHAALHQHAFDELRDRDVPARPRVLPFRSDARACAPIGKATRRATTSGAPRMIAPWCGCGRRAHASSRGARASRTARNRPSGSTRQPPLRAASKSGAPSRASRVDSTPSGARPSIEAQRLPLSSAHRPARVQVEDPHQLMILALEYLRNV